MIEYSKNHAKRIEEMEHVLCESMNVYDKNDNVRSERLEFPEWKGYRDL